MGDATLPVLSPMRSWCTPKFSSSVRCRLASGMFLKRTWRPPFRVPAPPPARIIGMSIGEWLLLSAIPAPYIIVT